MKFLILIFISSLAYGQQKQSEKIAAKIPENQTENLVGIFQDSYGTQDYKIRIGGGFVVLCSTSTSTQASTSGTTDAFIPAKYQPSNNIFYSYNDASRFINWALVIHTSGAITAVTDNNQGGGASAALRPTCITWIKD